MLRSKVIQLEESDRILKNQNTLLQRVVAQQKAMIDKVKSQRKELLSFYKLNKKHEINQSQIKSQVDAIKHLKQQFEYEKIIGQAQANSSAGPDGSQYQVFNEKTATAL